MAKILQCDKCDEIIGDEDEVRYTELEVTCYGPSGAFVFGAPIVDKSFVLCDKCATMLADILESDWEVD